MRVRRLGQFDVYRVGTGGCRGEDVPLTFALYRLNYSGFSSTVYDPSTYDDTPQYEWDATFNAAAFARDIDYHNSILFEKLKVVICQKLQIPHQGYGCKLVFSSSFLVHSFISIEPPQHPHRQASYTTLVISTLLTYLS